MTHKVFVGIGSNYEREDNIRVALASLDQDFSPLQISSFYETTAICSTKAVVEVENYYNLVIGFSTQLSPQQLIEHLKNIERQAGPRNQQHCPLDLDLLLYDDLIQHKMDIDIPRQDILDYAYVAVPLAELIADQKHPETGITYREYSQSKPISSQQIEKVMLPLGVAPC